MMRKTNNTQQPPNVNIAVENFGPIEKAEIDLRPLTVFVGESNTGKTYLAALIYALQRIFEGISRVPWSPHRILRLNHPTQSLSKETQETLKKLAVTGLPFKFSDSPQWMRERLQSDLKDTEGFVNELKRYFDLESASELIRFTESQNHTMKVLLEVREVNQILWSFGIHNSGSGITTSGFVNGDTILPLDHRAALSETLDTGDWRRREPIRVFSWNASATSYYLPAARSGIMQSHRVIASSLVDRATRVGLERFSEIPMFSGMIADFLKQIINYDERRLSSDEMSGIAQVLEDEVLRGEIEVRKPAGHPEFRYRPQKAEQALRMNQSSSMVSELAPLVLFLRGVVRPGDTLIIEEPEAHLHPAAQTKVAVILARLVRAGVRVIITTHSDWLLEQIGNLVREGEVMKLGKNQAEPTTWLTKEEVGAWRFSTDKPVQEIPFEHIAGIEPSEYGEVAEALYNRSVDLRTQLEEATGGTEVEQE